MGHENPHKYPVCKWDEVISEFEIWQNTVDQLQKGGAH